MNASVTFVTLLLVEYCSYKGLTHKIALGHSSFFSVEYCSYKGLTRTCNYIILWLRFLMLNIVLIKDLNCGCLSIKKRSIATS